MAMIAKYSVDAGHAGWIIAFRFMWHINFLTLLSSLIYVQIDLAIGNDYSQGASRLEHSEKFVYISFTSLKGNMFKTMFCKNSFQSIALNRVGFFCDIPADIHFWGP